MTRAGGFQMSQAGAFIQSPARARNVIPFVPNECVACCPDDLIITDYPPPKGPMLTYPNLCATFSAPLYRALDGVSICMNAHFNGIFSPPVYSLYPSGGIGWAGEAFVNPCPDAFCQIEYGLNSEYFCLGSGILINLTKCCPKLPSPADTGDGEDWAFSVSINCRTLRYDSFYNPLFDRVSGLTSIKMKCGPIRGLSDDFYLTPGPSYVLDDFDVLHCSLGYTGPYPGPIPNPIGPIRVAISMLKTSSSADYCQGGTGFCYKGFPAFDGTPPLIPNTFGLTFFGTKQLFGPDTPCTQFDGYNPTCPPPSLEMGTSFAHPPDATAPDIVAKVTRSTPCKYLGKDTGFRVQCDTCRGRVALKVFECEKYKTCTQSRMAVGHQSCQMCGSYEARE